MGELLRLEDISVQFGSPSSRFARASRVVRAVERVSLTIDDGETVGLVGESGSGKTTLGRAIVGLQSVSAGRITLQGRDLTDHRGAGRRGARGQMQMVFQDPSASLSPRQTMGQILDEFQVISGVRDAKARRDRSVELLDLVGLGDWALSRYAHEFSGGQRQRVALARALTVRPKLIVLDEPTSALDVSISAQIINLLVDIQKELEFSFLLITHDLALVRHLAERVFVMYRGEIVETARCIDLFREPLHPYSQALIDAVPIPDVTRERAKRRSDRRPDTADPEQLTSGCRYRTRCGHVIDVCVLKEPALLNWQLHHAATCHRVAEISHLGLELDDLGHDAPDQAERTSDRLATQGDG